MRLLLVSDFFPPVRGGLEHHVDALAGALADRGHEVHVATLTPKPVATHPGVRTHPIPSAAARVLPHADADRPFHPPLPDPAARRALRALLREVQPDLVHGHSWLTVSLPRSSPPVVMTAHDYGLVCQLRTLVRSDGDLCAGPGSHCFSCGKASWGAARSALMGLGTPAGRRLLPLQRVFAVSEAVAAPLRERLKAPVHVVPNFLPDPPAVPEPLAPLALPDGPYLAFAGDPGRHKGVDLLLELWAQDPPPAQLLLAVTRPLDRPVPPGVDVRTLTRGEVSTAFAGAVAALVPSLWPDPFPTTALEAMAVGTPVIASRAGGLVDMLRDGVDGLLVPLGDRDALGAAIRRLLSEPETAAAMGAAARERVRQFRASAVVGALEGHYAEVLAAAPAR